MREQYNVISVVERADILLVYNKHSLVHKIICFVTRKESKEYKAGHVMLYLFGDLVADATGALGVRERVMPPFYKGEHKVYRARYNSINEEIRNRIINIALEKTHKKDKIRYAFLQIPLILFKYLFKLKNIPDVSKKAMVCSEFATQVYKEADVPLFIEDSEEVTPNHFFSNKKLLIKEIE